MSQPRTVKPIPFFGTLVLGLAIGALLVGYGMFLPLLEGHNQLIDANLAKAISYPLSLRLAESLLASHIVLALLLPRWVSTRFATTLGVLLTGAALFFRFWLLPEVHAAWTKVDLVAQRPLSALYTAQQWSFYQYTALFVMLVMLLILVALTTRPTSAATVPN